MKVFAAFALLTSVIAVLEFNEGHSPKDHMTQHEVAIILFYSKSDTEANPAGQEILVNLYAQAEEKYLSSIDPEWNSFSVGWYQSDYKLFPDYNYKGEGMIFPAVIVSTPMKTHVLPVGTDFKLE